VNDPELSTPNNLDANELKAWVETHNEKNYLIIDVRQPQEYRHGHIPGAMFLPLLDLESKLFDLPADRDLIFYCSNGGRSLAAATLVIDAEVTNRRVYNLSGGILRWYGQTLSDFPKVKALDESGGIDALLYTAMNLEKGAWRFYDFIANRHAAEPWATTFETLRRAETAHAAVVYSIWASRNENPPAFENLFDNLKGDILEGGESLTEVLAEASSSVTEETCINLIELSLLIEYRAFELYRTVADRTPDDDARVALLALAQAEKAHMRVLTQAIETCSG
jgi:rhodanese-related sulfurtransferase/rubrerythrin